MGICTVERCQTYTVNTAEIQNQFEHGNIIMYAGKSKETVSVSKPCNHALFHSW